MIVKVKRLRKNGSAVPTYQSAQAAGLDLVADLDAPLALEPGARAAVSTGIALEIPVGFEGQVRPRSGRALEHGLTLINSPGTVDADYRGELKVLVVNLGAQPLRISPGERIAQLVIAPVVHVEVMEVDELEETARGEGGFGHTGR